jgi:hypothetical protein
MATAVKTGCTETSIYLSAHGAQAVHGVENTDNKLPPI